MTVAGSPDRSGPLRPVALFLAILLLVAAGAGVVGYHLWTRERSAVPDLPGDLLSWNTLQQKQDLAAYLNRNVLVPGFSAEVVTVKRRQNYWSIAKAAQVTIDSVIGFNPDLSNLDAFVGEPVLVPNRRGSLYQVAAGDTPAGLEQRLNLKPGLIASANRVGITGLEPGQVLFLPDTEPRDLTPAMRDLFEQRDFIRSPLAGHFTSMMGERVDPFTGVVRFHNGVDIGARFNTPVGAAAAGVVVLAGWNDGFGRCIIIRHAQGYRTLYGHLNQILVHVGEHVRQHQIIGRVGMTGRTTGPHLHFTVWHNGRLQNPLKYLW